MDHSSFYSDFDDESKNMVEEEISLDITFDLKEALELMGCELNKNSNKPKKRIKRIKGAKKTMDSKKINPLTNLAKNCYLHFEFVKEEEEVQQTRQIEDFHLNNSEIVNVNFFSRKRLKKHQLGFVKPKSRVELGRRMKKRMF